MYVAVLRGRLLSWLSVGALVVLSAGAALLSIAHTAKSHATAAPTPAPGPSPLQASIAGFAGYGVFGQVDQVAAYMQVPQIKSIPAGAPFGTASTWIGAQNEEGAFAQVGITESENRTARGFTQEYDGFWSDTARQFHPVGIGSVRVGDRISVDMRLGAAGWVLRFEDVSTGSIHSISTGYGAGQQYDFAEWFQEDPVLTADPLRNLPYPATSRVTFSQIELDGSTPHLDGTDAESMDVADGPLLVPTSFRSDGFIVAPATGYARQYLFDVSSYNLALQAYGLAVYDQRPSSGGSHVVAESIQLVRALDIFENELSDQSWPTRVEGAVQALLAKNYLLSIDLRDIESTGPTSAVEDRVLADETVSRALAEMVRSELGLPGPS